MRNPDVQTYTAQIAAEYLSEKLNTEIRIKELTVTAFFDVVLRGVEIKDLHHNDIIKSDRIQVNIQKSSLRNRQLNLNKIILDGSSFSLAIYKNDSISNLQALLDGFRSKEIKSQTESDTTTVNNSWVLSCKAVEVNDGAFSLTNEHKGRWPRGVDFDYMDIINLNLNIDDLNLLGDSLIMNVNELSLNDRNSGFIIDSFEGEFILSNTILDAKNLKIKVMDSKLDLDFSFNYNSFRDFNNFEENIRIIADIRPTRLNLADIGYFAPELFIMEDVFDLSLKVEGTVSDFKSKNLIFDYGEFTHFEGDVDMKGLPFIETTHSYAKIRNLTTTAYDIESFAIPANPSFIDLADEFQELGVCEFIGTLEGVYNDFDANLVMRSEAGNFLTDMKMTTNESGDLTRYTGRLRSINFDVGKVFNVQNYLGKMNLDIDFDGSGLRKKEVALLMNGVIDSLEFKGNKYNQVGINGRLYDNKFSGNLKVEDENLFLDFNGLIDHSKQIPAYDFQATIRDAFLYKLNLFEHNPTAVLSTNLNINFTGSDLDNYNGFIQIDSTSYYQDEKNYFLDKIFLESQKISEDRKHIELKSDYIDADLTGKFLFKDLMRSVNNHLALYMPVVFSDTTQIFDAIPPQDFEFNADLKNTTTLTDVFFPDLEVSDNAVVHGLYNSEQNRIHIEANADQLTYKGIRFEQWYVKTNNDEDAFLILAGSNDMIFKEASENDTLALGLENLNVLATIQHDSIDYRLRWDDYDEKDENTGYLAGYLKYFGPNQSELKIYRTDFRINNSVWGIDENNFIVFDSTRVVLSDLNISSDSQHFGFDGIISEISQDSVKFEFDNWEFSNFDLLITNLDLALDGTGNG